jgi:hypothetical protein
MAYQILKVNKEVVEDNLELTDEQIQEYFASEEFNYFIYDSYEDDTDIFSALLEEKGEAGCEDIRIIKPIIEE